MAVANAVANAAVANAVANAAVANAAVANVDYVIFVSRQRTKNDYDQDDAQTYTNIALKLMHRARAPKWMARGPPWLKSQRELEAILDDAWTDPQAFERERRATTPPVFRCKPGTRFADVLTAMWILGSVKDDRVMDVVRSEVLTFPKFKNVRVGVLQVEWRTP